VRRYLPLAMVAGLAMWGCDNESSAWNPPFDSYRVTAAGDSGSVVALQMKRAFERGVRSEIAKLECHIEDVEAEVRRAGAKARGALDDALLELVKRKDAVHRSLCELESSSVEAAETGRPRMEEELVGLRKAYEVAASTFR